MMTAKTTASAPPADDDTGDHRAWVNRHTTAVVAVGASLALLFLALALVRPETFQRGVGSATNRADALARAREFWLKLAAGAGAVAGALIAWGKFELSKGQDERAQLQLDSERFAGAIQLLGSDRTDVVLGGLYSLESLGQTSRPYQTTITEVLCAFVRQRTALRVAEEGGMAPAAQSVRDPSRPELPKPTAEVQAALTILGRRTDWRGEINLGWTDLRGADLQRADLRGADLRRSDLRGAKLIGCRLDGAKLYRADLRRANLDEVDLRAVDLTNSRLNDVPTVLV